jgi:hypothetical protein
MVPRGHSSAIAFLLLELLPINFSYPAFAAIILLNGLAMGCFAAPNRAAVMNSLPARHCGAGGGMNSTFQNSAQVFSIGIFFSLMITGLAAALPESMTNALEAHHVPAEVATRRAAWPTRTGRPRPSRLSSGAASSQGSFGYPSTALAPMITLVLRACQWTSVGCGR